MEQPEAGLQNQAQESQVMRVDEVTMAGGTVELEEQDCVVTGNVYRGGVIRGKGNVCVQGVVSGVAQSLCVIEVGGTASLERSMSCGRVHARRVVIQGDVEHSRIRTDMDAEIQGDLVETQISVGNRTADLQALRQFRVEMERLEQRLEEFKIRTGLSSRRFIRDYPQVNLQMGNIFIPGNRELRVDLTQFYKAVADRSAEEVDQALEEFYLRVVVGVLTRTNRHYISRNPSRHTVFLKLVEELRGHLLSVRQADKLRLESRALGEKRKKMLNEVVQPLDVCVRVCGEIGENVTIQVNRFEGMKEPETASGSVEMNRVCLEARTVRTQDGLLLEMTDANGEHLMRRVGPEGLRNGEFVVEDDQLIWRPFD